MVNKQLIIISAYDVSNGETSEGYVAFNILKRLKKEYKIILITRKNNKERLLKDVYSFEALRGVCIIGFDLPKWARWWKRGNFLYFPYAYIWQLLWPLALLKRKLILKRTILCHILNFHNDSIPSLAWILNSPVVWGPINHNELALRWRREFWPWSIRTRAVLGFLLRRVAWKCDPFLKLTIKNATIILASGDWVKQRLKLSDGRVFMLNQQGVDRSTFKPSVLKEDKGHNCLQKVLIYAGRLDWIKGLDIIIEALYYLPSDFKLLIIGDGPAEGNLIKLVADKKLDNRVFFQPSVPREVLPSLYSDAFMFVFPSAEAGGLAWLEALSCGLPVIGFSENTLLGTCFKIPNVVLAQQGNSRKESAQNIALAVLEYAGNSIKKDVTNNNYFYGFDWDEKVSEISNHYKKIAEKSEAL